MALDKNNWTVARLTSISNPKQYPTISTSQLKESGYPVYGANGIIGYFNKFTHEKETLLITCRGATCGSLNISQPFSYVNGNAMALDNLSDDVDLKFLYYLLKHRGFKNEISGTAQPQITRIGLEKVEIPLPPHPTQQKIAAALDQADAVRRLARAAVAAHDDLAESLFLEMFGKGIEHRADFHQKNLFEIAEITSGVAKNEGAVKNDFIEVPYMRVANVQDRRFDLTEIKTIRVSNSDLKKYLLRKGDILLTEGGDNDKLGRGAVWQGQIEPCIHQNHIFRVRISDDEVSPTYLSWHLGSAYGKKYFLKAAKQTTGIASINLTQLKNFKAIIPPISLQNRFAEMLLEIQSQKALAQAQQAASEAVFSGLLSEVFG